MKHAETRLFLLFDFFNKCNFKKFYMKIKFFMQVDILVLNYLERIIFLQIGTNFIIETVFFNIFKIVLNYVKFQLISAFFSVQ